MQLKFEESSDKTPKVYSVLTPYAVKVGELYQEVDGYYYFTSSCEGYWSSFILRQIADKLEEVNKSWNDLIDRTINNANDNSREPLD